VKNLLYLLVAILVLSCSKQIEPTMSISQGSNQITSTIQFNGYTWNVKNGPLFGPGPNLWSRNNVWVDTNGFLHLKITKDSVTGKWFCAEVSTQQTFGFGKWQFWIEGRIDRLDKNVVLGLFNYSGIDGFDEMDIEWARWGDKSYPNCNYTVWPAENGFKNFSYVKDVVLTGKNTTQRFTRTGSSVSFQSLQGFTNTDKQQLVSAICTSPPNSVSTLAMPAYINLWLMNGLPPANGKEVEIIVHKFSYTQGK
jgi:hypothetical protein